MPRRPPLMLNSNGKIEQITVNDEIDSARSYILSPGTVESAVTDNTFIEANASGIVQRINTVLGTVTIDPKGPTGDTGTTGRAGSPYSEKAESGTTSLGGSNAYHEYTDLSVPIYSGRYYYARALVKIAVSVSQALGAMFFIFETSTDKPASLCRVVTSQFGSQAVNDSSPTTLTTTVNSNDTTSALWECHTTFLAPGDDNLILHIRDGSATGTFGVPYGFITLIDLGT